jgi:hypothetical protein
VDNEEAAKRMALRQSQAMMDQRSREDFERKWLGSKEADRQQKLTAWDDIYNRLALNKKLNREGNLIMKLNPAFDQYGEYNGYRVPIRNPLSMFMEGTDPNEQILRSTRQGLGYTPGQPPRYQFQGGAQETGSTPTPAPTGKLDATRGRIRPPQMKKEEWFFDEGTQRYYPVSARS